MTDLYISMHTTGLTLGMRALAGLRLTGRMAVVRDRWAGELSFDEGRIVGAAFGAEQGILALEAILCAMPHARCTFLEGPPASERNLDLAGDHLERHLDELGQRAAALASVIPSLTAVPRRAELDDLFRPGEQVVLPGSALATLLLVDGQRTVQDLCRDRGLVRALDDLALLVHRGLVCMEARSGEPVTRLAGLPYRLAALLRAARVHLRLEQPLSRLVAARRAEGYAARAASAERWARRVAEARWRRPRPILPLALGAVLALTALMTMLLINGLGNAARRPPSYQGGATAIEPAQSAAPGPAQTRAMAGTGLRTVLDERFTGNALHWPSDPESTAWVADGTSRPVTRRPGQFIAIPAPLAERYHDVVVTATFRKTGGPPGGGYGLIVRDQGLERRPGVEQTGRFYLLAVSEQGVGIRRREREQWVDLVPWTPAAEVRPGGDPNTLAAVAIGDQLGLMVNGVLLATVRDRVLGEGATGLFVSGDGNEVMVERFLVELPS